MHVYKASDFVCMVNLRFRKLRRRGILQFRAAITTGSPTG